MNQWPVTIDRQWSGEKGVTASRLVASDLCNGGNRNGHNRGQNGYSLSKDGEKATSQNGDNESLYTFTAWKIWFRNYYVAHAL